MFTTYSPVIMSSKSLKYKKTIRNGNIIRENFNATQKLYFTHPKFTVIKTTIINNKVK